MDTKANPDHPAFKLLSQAHSSEVASTIFEEKIRLKSMNLRATSPDANSQDARAARRRRRLLKHEHALKRSKPKRLSAKDKRALGLYDIESKQSYDSFVPLNQLWIGYISDVLGIKDNSYFTGASAGPILAAADFHGAELEVVRSRCVSRVGLAGIVLKDNQKSFLLITRLNHLRLVPKEHTIFRVEIPQVEPNQGQNDNEQYQPLPKFIFELHGSQLEVRAPDRAIKKFKQKRLDDL